MSVIAEGVLTGDIVLADTLAAFPEASVEAEYQAAPNSAILTVSGCPHAAFESSLGEDPTVDAVDRIAAVGDRRIYRIGIALDRPMLVAEGTRFGVQVLSITADDGDWRLRLRVQDRDTLVRVRDLADDLGVAFRVATVYRERPKDPSGDVLTPAQEEVLAVAHENGYFERPREASLEDLADSLDISSSAVGGRLRRAIGSLVAERVEGGGPE